MKKLMLLATLWCSLFFLSAQTYVVPPYLEDCEGTPGTEWLGIIPTNSTVAFSPNGIPVFGSQHLLIDDGTAGGTNLKAALLHTDLSGGLNYTLEFWMKDFGDEDDAQDGIFFWDTTTAQYVKVFDFVSNGSAKAYKKYSLNINELALANGIDLTDTFKIAFQEYDDRAFNSVDADGFAFDSIALFETPPFSAGEIAGADTVCFNNIGSTTINLTSTSDAAYGSGTITYTWQYTTNFMSWTNFGGNTAQTSFSSPTTTRFYRRCATTSGGDGPSCSNIIPVFVSQDINPQINGLAASYCNNNANITIYGTPIIGTFSGTGITNLGNGSATFSPSTGATGNRTIEYRFADSYGCRDTAKVITNILLTPTANFTGLGASYFITDTTRYELVGTPSGGSFTGFGIVVDSFVPAYVGTPQSVNITYTVTSGNGCTDTETKSTNVTAGGTGTITGLAATYCVDNPAVLITGNPKGGYFYINPSYPYYGMLDGTPDKNNPSAPDTAYFRPSVVGQGTYYIYYYHYTTGWTVQYVTVNALPALSIGGLNSTYCLKDGITALTGYDNGVPVSGAFSGPGISGNNFNPQTAGVGTHAIVFTYTNGSTGCDNSVSFNTTVNPMPNPSFTSDSTFHCNTDPIDTLVGSPAGGVFYGTGTSNIGSGLATFSPNITPGVYDISYSYTDANSCTVIDTQQYTVKKIPTVNLTGLASSVICGNGTVVNLTGSPTEGTFPNDSGYFRGDSLVEGIIDYGNSTAVLRPDLAIQDTQFYITYIYTDNFGCTDSIVKPLKYSSPPILTLSGLDSIYCQDDEAGYLTATTNQLGSGNTWFNGQGTSKTGPLTGLFDPQSVTLGVHVIDFEQINSDGCQSFVYDSTRVISRPTVDFAYSAFCNNDSISFTDFSSTSIYDAINLWIWNYDNGLPKDTVQMGKTWYQFPGKYNVNLTVGTVEGCTNNKTITDTIGQAPLVDFFWDNICFGDVIQFTDTSEAVIIDPIKTWDWSFGDANSSTLQDPTHSYSAISSYDVKLKLTTNKNCSDSLTKTINIRPVVNTFPYLEDFETDNGGWFADGVIADNVANTWLLGVAGGGFSDSATGNKSFFTGVGNYVQDEHSYVDGACFDFSTLERPMIVFDRKSNFNPGFDGANFQYSTDNGMTWNNLGSIASGISWFDQIAVASTPGDKLIGWSDVQKLDWTEARHDLDLLAGNSAVKLRFAFATSPNSQDLRDGFAFDNIWIGERTRNVLYEHFTNYSDQNSDKTDTDLNDFVTLNSLDMVDVQYHINTPGQDAFNTENPADVSTRSLYYGVFASGRGVLDGSSDGFAGSTAAFVANENYLHLNRLKDPLFDIQINADINSSLNLNITPTITALADFSGQEILVHTVVVEKDVAGVVGTFGQTEFKSVMRKLLPDATGTPFARDWLVNDSETLDLGWTIKNVKDQTQLRVLVFVQNNATKEIYQAAYTDSFAISTGIDSEAVSNNFIAYPNPSNGLVNMLWNKPLSDNTLLEVYDSQGKKVLTEQLYKGINFTSLDLSGYAQGIYHIRLHSSDNVFNQEKKIVITK